MADSPTGDIMADYYIGYDGAVFAIGFSCLIIPFDSAVWLLLDGSYDMTLIVKRNYVFHNE